MAPLKAPRYLVADIETNRFDGRNMEYSKSHTSAPALDLSKFPAKKILGVGKRTSKPASKAPKSAGLGTGKSTGVQQLKKRPPQVVKAPKPSGSEGPKHKGSISFAHKARGMGDCYTTWAAAGTNEKSPSTCIKGRARYGRMTSIEIDVFRFEGEVLSEDSVNLQSTTDDELLEGDMWLADPRNSASSIEMHESWISKHECEPPHASSGGSHESGDGSVGFEPPEMSSCGSYDDTESLFLEHNTYNMQMGQETCSLESVSTNDDQLEAPYIVQQMPELQPEPKRCLKISTNCAEGGLYSDVGSAKGINVSPAQPGGASYATCNEQKKPSSILRQLYQRKAHGIPRSSSIDCPPSPIKQQCAPSCSSSMENFPSVPDARLTLVPSCEQQAGSAHGIEPDTNGSSPEIIYRGSTESTAKRRGSLGFARRVLGATFGITVNTVMLVSGVTAARAFLGRADRKSREESTVCCTSIEECQGGELVAI